MQLTLFNSPPQTTPLGASRATLARRAAKRAGKVFIVAYTAFVREYLANCEAANETIFADYKLTENPKPQELRAPGGVIQAMSKRGEIEFARMGYSAARRSEVKVWKLKV